MAKTGAVGKEGKSGKGGPDPGPQEQKRVSDEAVKMDAKIELDWNWFKVENRRGDGLYVSCQYERNGRNVTTIPVKIREEHRNQVVEAGEVIYNNYR